MALVGRNGSGKTNFLDAIHHLSLGRSLFQRQDAGNIQFEAPFYRLDAALLDQEGKSHRMEIVLPRGGKKSIVWDSVPVERIKELVGRLPVVYILPDEPYQMNESSEWRRNFLDQCLCQVSPEYLFQLAQYKKWLLQRNATLKLFAERQRYDAHLLDVIDEKLSTFGEAILNARLDWLPVFMQFFQTQYAQLSEGRELPHLEYQNQLGAVSFSDYLRNGRQADREAQRTLQGPHRDDLDFRLNNRSLKKTGSQGQQKSFLLALKFGQYAFLQNQLGIAPWLLLDDIFDKLDDRRIASMLEMVSAPEMGQVFLTDARPQRTESLLQQGSQAFQLISLES